MYRDYVHKTILSPFLTIAIAKTTQRMFYCSDHAREIDKKLLGIFQLRGFRNQLHVKIKQ